VRGGAPAPARFNPLEDMERESAGRSGPRRPRRDRDREGGRGRGRERDRDRDPAEAKERIEREFTREIEMRISYFLQSQEPELELEPMNSYRRRIVHNLAGRFHLRTESRGEDRDRYVCLVKTEETVAEPQGAAPAGAQGVAPAETPRVRLWDFGSQTFPVNPGPNGIHMALKSDGSLEIFRPEERSHVLAERVITSREFRVRQGQLLMPGDPGY
jgi:R3H domain